ncbi:MAG: bifunctional adenosylcobinamide kinase/adenosylcobinamide-phosphate guanylyltransferase [Cyanobium sp.]
MLPLPAVTPSQSPDLPERSFTVICGPSGGGKSRWAEHLAHGSGKPVVYLATGPLLPEDPDWQCRLERHRRRRPSGWRCQEVGGELSAAIDALAPDETALIDSLGTWVSAWLDTSAEHWSRLSGQLVTSLLHCRASVLLVSEEVGWGVVPSSAQGCLFRQRLVDLVQQLMPHAQGVWLVVAGRAIDLQVLGRPVPPEP